MTISAGAGSHVEKPAAFTAVQMGSEVSASAFTDGTNHLLVGRGHGVPVALKVFLSVALKDLLNGTHDDTFPMTRLIRA